MAAVITRPQLVPESPVNRDHSVTKAVSSLYVAKTPEDLWSSFREAGWGMPQTCCYSLCIHLHNLQSFNPLSSCAPSLKTAHVTGICMRYFSVGVAMANGIMGVSCLRKQQRVRR